MNENEALCNQGYKGYKETGIEGSFSDMENRLNELEKKFGNLLVDYKDSHRANAVGLQNVYDKFIELEKRQKEIEDLLKSERIYDLIKNIPDEEMISKLLIKIEATEIGKLNHHLRRIKEDLEELSSTFK